MDGRRRRRRRKGRRKRNELKAKSKARKWGTALWADNSPADTHKIGKKFWTLGDDLMMTSIVAQ
jgi:hypothetical protein